MKIKQFVPILTVALFLIPLHGFASCPDKVTCTISWGVGAEGDSAEFKNLGNIAAPTCYKFGKGCRPWHCSGNSSNADYWLDRCISYFGVRHDPKHNPEYIRVSFPGATVDGESNAKYRRELK